MQCPFCGKETREGSQFCPACGKAIESPPLTQKRELVGKEGRETLGNDLNLEQVAGKRRSLKIALVSCAVLIVLAGAIVAVYFLFMRDGTGDDTETARSDSVQEILEDESTGPTGKIAFIRDGDVWVYDLEADKESKLTDDGTCSNPDIRPDGKKVAYTSDIDGYLGLNGYTTCSQVYEVDVSTKKSRKITDMSTWRFYSPSYSSDGKTLVFGRFDTEQSGDEYSASEANLCTIDLDADRLEVIAVGESGYEWIDFCDPAFCYEDKEIAYINSFAGGGDAYLIPREGGAEKTVTLEGYSSADNMIVSMVFPPNSEKMIASLFGEYGFYVEDLQSGEVTHIDSFPDGWYPQCFSPGGSYIAFSDYSDYGTPAIYIADIEDSFRRKITSGFEPDWGR